MVTILVVEDEPDIRSEIVDTLQFEGFTVQVADNGRTGIELARQHLPDIIICDIMMPEVDGYGVLEALRQDAATAAIPFVFLTAKADMVDWRTGMNLGADDYLPKPFEFDELLRVINVRLKRQQSFTERERQQVRHLTELVANELRQPVESILTIQNIIARRLNDISPAQLADLVDMLGEGGQRLSRLVDQMVYTTYLETAQLSPDTIQRRGQPLQVWAVLTAAINLGRQFAQVDDVLIEFDDEDRGAQVLTDTDALKHAFAELIAYVLETANKNALITIRQWQQASTVHVTVQWTPKQDPPPPGIGLQLAQRIMRVHGGTIEFEAEQIAVTLPIITQEG